MDILYQSDENYAPYLGVSVCSLLENNRGAETINIYVINDSISEENLSKLAGMVSQYGRKLILLEPGALLAEDSVTRIFTSSGKRLNTHSFLKLLFQRMLREEVRRILYIDCDTVVTGDISPLFSLEMGSCPIGMVQDSLVTKSKVSVGLENTERYYNSGVILINVEQWKKTDCESKIMNHLRDVRVYGTVDQDVLNVVLRNQIMTLPVRYNLQPVYLDYSLRQYNRVYRHAEPYYSDKEIREAVQNPVVLHFLRYLGQSPWHRDSIHPCRPYFEHYLMLSPWKNLVRKSARNDLIFRIERALYRLLPKGLFLCMFNIFHERMITKGNSAK